jgi:hypothetical protein
MTRLPRWLGALAAAAIVIVVVRLVAGARPPAPRRSEAAAPRRPEQPPGPDDRKPARPAEPRMPVVTPAWRAELAAQVASNPRPGEAAFRLFSDRYVDDNLVFAERQAADEGMTVAEVRELTYFGLLVMATQRTAEVEEIIGRPLDDDQRRELADLMQSANGQFRDDMRAAVRRKASEADRWQLIRDTGARYRAALNRITGLDEARLDDLLAGNLALPGAPAHGVPEPSADQASHVRDQPATPARPATPRP